MNDLTLEHSSAPPEPETGIIIFLQRTRTAFREPEHRVVEFVHFGANEPDSADVKFTGTRPMPLQQLMPVRNMTGTRGILETCCR